MKNKKGSRTFFSKLLIVCICLFLASSLVPRAQNVWQLSERKKDLEEQKASLLVQQEKIARELEGLDCPQTIERIAREELGMVKRGETYIVQVINRE